MSTSDQASAASLVQSASEALRRQNTKSALDLIETAERQDPTNIDVHLTKALALRVAGRLDEAVDALDAALAINPYNFLALLSKGALLERQGRGKAAAEVYANAIKIAPPHDQVPPGLAAPLQRAEQVVEANKTALQAHLKHQTQALRSRFAGRDLERFDEALDIFAGLKRVYVQEPALLHYPRLPAIPFYDRDLFPWLADLEAATPIIRAELEAALASADEAFQPYIAYPPGAPVNQWAELNHSRDWRSLWLWRDGERIDEACVRCPRTAALLESLPMADQPGFAPTALFSALAPHAHIPPHTGSTNTRLLVHLPLVLPGAARFRVGNVVREWRLGEAWVFDDTIEHEAWNDADELRVILIFDIWNPFLTEPERGLVTEMLQARRDYQAAES